MSARGLEDLRRDYESAFSENGKTIRDVLDDPALDRLQALRNVLVHRGGKADEKFCKNVKDLPMARFAGIQEKSPVLLDGEIVRGVANPAVQACVKLIRAVDGWLATH